MTISGSAPGFNSVNRQFAVVQAGLEIVDLPGNFGAGGADRNFRVGLGVPNGPETGLSRELA